MVAQLVLNDQGVYEYKEVQQPVKRTINSQAFEAYEGQKKEELVSAPSVTEQTEKITREIPGQVTFDEKTGQFKQVDTRKQAIDYTPGERTPESTEATALDKVLSMQPMAGTQDGGLDRAYKLIEQQQKAQKALTRAQTFQSYLQSGTQLYNIASGKDYSIFTGGGIGKNITPLKFKSPTWTGMNVGQSTLGGVGTAGMAGYAVSGLLGGSKKQQKTSGVGSAIGMAAGGPVGGVVGGVIGHVLGCFSPDTLVTMADNTTKPIIDIDLKDNIAVGGFVFALGKFLINDLYEYKGIKVSGTHMVNEEGIWKEVKDTKHGKSLGNEEHVVYTLGTEKRRILINNILFTDYFEVEEKDKLRELGNTYFDNWKDQVLILNKENKKILNAS
jgi:hypothetical protein